MGEYYATGRGGTGGGVFGPGELLTAVLALLALLWLLLLPLLLLVSSLRLVSAPFPGLVPAPPRAIMLSR